MASKDLLKRILDKCKADGRSARDTLLVTLAAIADLPAEDLRTLTVEGALEKCHRAPYAALIKALVQRHAASRALPVGSPLFGSRRLDWTGEVRAIGRVQCWRILRDALRAALGSVVAGPLKFLRGILKPQTSAMTTPAQPAATAARSPVPTPTPGPAVQAAEAPSCAAQPCGPAAPTPRQRIVDPARQALLREVYARNMALIEAGGVPAGQLPGCLLAV